MKCFECEFGNGDCRGLVCPASKITPADFKAGCNLAKASTSHRIPLQAKSPRSKAVKPATRQPDRLPNRTELEYATRFLAGKDYKYEGHSCKMENGHTYTGDWAVFVEGKVVEIHECKGGWSFASQGRSRLAFDQCRIEFPSITFIWAKKSKVKGWVVKK